MACELLDVVELTKEKEFLAIDYYVRENPSELDAVEEFGYALLKVVDDSVSKYLAPPSQAIRTPNVKFVVITTYLLSSTVEETLCFPRQFFLCKSRDNKDFTLYF